MVLNHPPIPKTAKPGIAPAVRPLAVAVVACVIVILLFSPAGVIYSKADLSFLTAPLLSLFLIRLAAQLCGLYLPGYVSYKAGMAAASVLNGLAFAMCFYLFLANVPILAKFSVFENRADFLADLSRTAWYVVLFIAGVTGSKLSEIFRETITGKPFYPIFNGLGQFLAGLAIWQFLAVFSGPGVNTNKIGLVIFAGITAIALCNAGHYGETAKNPFLADASRWLITSTLQKFVIGALIAAYIIFVRPAIASVFSYAAIIEWLIVCLIGWRIFSGIKNGIRQQCAVDVYETDWKKHIQLLSNMQGDEFPRLGEIQDLFTSAGSRSTLLVYLTLLLHNNKIPPEGINRILSPLIDYTDTRIPWFAFGWEQKQIAKKNAEKRRRILDEIMTDLKYIINPASRKIEEQADEQDQP